MQTALQTSNPLVFLGTETGKSNKTGNEFTVLKFGDPENFSNHTFFKNADIDRDLTGLQVGTQVQLTIGLESQGFTQRTSLLRIEKVAK